MRVTLNKEDKAFFTFICLVVLIAVVWFFSSTGCQTARVSGTILPTTTSTTVTTTTLPDENVTYRIPLSWEHTPSYKKYYGKAEWSDEIINHFHKNFDVYNSSTDFVEVCPKFKTLSTDQKLKALGEFWVATANHESAYNPSSNAVDVGSQSNKDTWSVGLYQMSVTDSANIYGYKFADLQDGLKNIKVAQEQLRRQVSKSGLFMLANTSPSRYWAVILKGNKYSQIPAIISQTRKQAPACIN